MPARAWTQREMRPALPGRGGSRDAFHSRLEVCMKTIAEINEKIAAGEAVVVDAEEMVGIVRGEGAKKAAEQVDVVTTGTFVLLSRSSSLRISIRSSGTGNRHVQQQVTNLWGALTLTYK